MTCPSITIRQLRDEIKSLNRPWKVMVLVLEILQYWPAHLEHTLPLEVAEAWFDARQRQKAEGVH
jgi:hypothetical protein